MTLDSTAVVLLHRDGVDRRVGEVPAGYYEVLMAKSPTEWVSAGHVVVAPGEQVTLACNAVRLACALREPGAPTPPPWAPTVHVEGTAKVRVEKDFASGVYRMSARFSSWEEPRVWDVPIHPTVQRIEVVCSKLLRACETEVVTDD